MSTNIREGRRDGPKNSGKFTCFRALPHCFYFKTSLSFGVKKLNEIPFPAYVSIIIKDGLDFDQLKAIGYTEIINFFCGQNEDNNWNNPLEFSWVGNYTGSLQSRST